jgi:DNA-binding transcriptional MerR regulator
MTSMTRKVPARGTAGTGSENSLRIGDLARRLGLTARALRYWEERGLLPPAERTSGGTRVYGDVHVRAARGILRLKRAGFSLEEITSLQQGMRNRGTALAGMRALNTALDEREQFLRIRIRESLGLLEELQTARGCVSLCDGCEGKPYDADCITCLSEASGHSVPDSLRGLLQAAAVNSRQDDGETR